MSEPRPGTDPRRRVVCVGLTTLDAIYTVAHHPEPDEKITAARQDLSAGGPAANAAVTCVALGSPTTLVTALGRHPLAEVAAEDLRAHGVRVLDATPGDVSAPALSSVYVQPATATRSVVSVNAVHRLVPVPQELPDAVTGAGVVLVDGHHPELVRAALEAARAGSGPERIATVLDGGSWKPHLDGLLEHVDWAVCGERFRVPGAAPTAAGEADTTQELLARGVSVVVFTHGPRPVTWRTARDSGTVEVPRVHAMDTLGAGDAFHGAVAHRLAALAPLGRDSPGFGSADPGSADSASPGLVAPPLVEDVLRAAARVAALRVTVLGPRAWLRELSRTGRR